MLDIKKTVSDGRTELILEGRLDAVTAPELDALERRMTAEIYQKHNVALTGISIYSVNLSDAETSELYHPVKDEVMAYDNVLQIHGFYANKEKKTVNLDVILDFALPDREAEFAAIKAELAETYPDWQFNLTMDIDA